MQIKLDCEQSLSFFAKLLHAKPKQAKLFTITIITLATALGVCEKEVMYSFDRGIRLVHTLIPWAEAL